MRNMGVGDDNSRVDRESFAAHKVGHARFEPMGVWSRYELGIAFGLGHGFCAIRRVRFWRLPSPSVSAASRLHSDDEHVRPLVADQCGFTVIQRPASVPDSKFVRLTKPRTPASAGRFPRQTSALILRSEAKPRVSKYAPLGSACSARTGASFEAAPRRFRTRGKLGEFNPQNFRIRTLGLLATSRRGVKFAL